MLDSSNEALNEEVTFNPEAFFKALCDDTKIELNQFMNIQFPVGWKRIVVELIQEIKQYAIDITSVTDKHKMLEVSFKVRKTTGETKVWRAINAARIQSMRTCVNCGMILDHNQRLDSGSMLCKECNKNSGKIGRTGTWLDKY